MPLGGTVNVTLSAYARVDQSLYIVNLFKYFRPHSQYVNDSTRQIGQHRILTGSSHRDVQ